MTFDALELNIAVRAERARRHADAELRKRIRVCGAPLANGGVCREYFLKLGRTKYCCAACKMRAFRKRHQHG